MTLDAKRIQQQLQEIIHAPFAILALDRSLENDGVSNPSGQRNKSFIYEDKIYFPFRSVDGVWAALVADENCLTTRERRLVETIIGSLEEAKSMGQADQAKNELTIEERMRHLGYWLLEQMDKDECEQKLPENLMSGEHLTDGMVPIFLTGEAHQGHAISYAQLHKLLDSYFGGDVLLIPLHDQEWLILARQELLLGAEDDRDRDSDISETMEEVLTAFSLGLYELIANEWVGIFHLAVSRPIVPQLTLPQSVGLLRETLFLGKIFRVTEHIHFSWELHLERLLYRIPDEQRMWFLQNTGTQSLVLEDKETMAVLETFFQLDCNVSETAKRLYVHRNTLIYRLDKIKQETGLDVRTFNDAVLVKLAQLLYKVTKTK